MQGVERWCFDLVVVGEAKIIVAETAMQSRKGLGSALAGAHCAAQGVHCTPHTNLLVDDHENNVPRLFGGAEHQQLDQHRQNARDADKKTYSCL